VEASFGRLRHALYLLEVYNVEALKPSGNFRPLPDGEKSGSWAKAFDVA
jgi:hypothetical protein